MDVNLAWAVAALFLGAFLSRWNALRQHAAEVHAAREQAFEAMQRDTWLALQDSLAELWDAARTVAMVVWQDLSAKNEAKKPPGSVDSGTVEDDLAIETPTSREVAPITVEDYLRSPKTTAIDNFKRVHLRSRALQSRLADDILGDAVEQALDETVEYYTWTIRQRLPEDGSAWPGGLFDELRQRQGSAHDTLTDAIERLGVLILQRPEPPTQPWRWPRRGRRN